MLIIHANVVDLTSSFSQMVQKKPLARQGKDHVIKRLVRQIRKLREKKPDEETKKTKFNRKAERLVEEIMALKVYWF